MRRLFCLALACAASLLVLAPALATTNVPATFTVKVTIKNAAIDMSPNHAVRGSTIIFILTNRGTKTQNFILGDVQRGPGHTLGFSRLLAPSQQKRIVMYLDIRGLLHYRAAARGTVTAKGIFTVR